MGGERLLSTIDRVCLSGRDGKHQLLVAYEGVQRPGGTPDNNSAFQRRVGGTNDFRPEGTAEKLQEAMGSVSGVPTVRACCPERTRH